MLWIRMRTALPRRACIAEKLRSFATLADSEVLDVADDKRQEFEDELLTPRQGRPEGKSGRALYHAILVQLKLFPDQHASGILKDLVDTRYRVAREVRQASYPRLRINAKKCLITLQKANMGEPRALTKMLEVAYAQRGKLKHNYMAPITSELTEPADELIPGRRRTRPPVAGKRLTALWKLQFEAKKISVDLPLGPGGEYGKPLAKSREANLRWKHHTDLLDRTLPPIPNKDYQHLVRIAQGRAQISQQHLPEWRTHTREEMLGRHKNPSSQLTCVSARNVRRAYDRILRLSPVLTQDSNGNWSAHYYNAGPELAPKARFQRLKRPLSDFDPVVSSSP